MSEVFTYDAWEPSQLLDYIYKLNCSEFVLANVTMRSNTAQGAGGSVFLTNETGFHNFCLEDILTGAPCYQQDCSCATAWHDLLH